MWLGWSSGCKTLLRTKAIKSDTAAVVAAEYTTTDGLHDGAPVLIRAVRGEDRKGETQQF